jgi:hypothetical protein
VRLTAIANLLNVLRAYKQVMKHAVYSHPAGLGVHLLQINPLLQSYSHQSAVRLSVFAIVTKQRAGYEFNSRRGRALFNPASRPALGYPQQPVQTATELRSLGIKRSGHVATPLPLATPYIKNNRSCTSTQLYVISRVVLCLFCLFLWTSAASHGCTAACWLFVPPALDVPQDAPAPTDAFPTLAAEVGTRNFA